MKSALIIARDAAHARELAKLIEDHGLADEVLVQADPTNDIAAQESLHRLASLGTLAAGAAHELNNLLTYITVTLDRLQRGYRNSVDADRRARERTMIEVAAECCGRMRNVLRGITGFARAGQHGRAPLRIEEVVDTAVELVRCDLAQVAALEIDRQDALPIVRGSADQLCQVMVNLLINALHALDGGGPDDNRIAIRMRRADDGIRVEVEDNGHGIPEQTRDRIFEPFFTTKPEGEGTGLGLFLCRSIVRKHGGELVIDSAVGRGTRVSVYLPTE
jgi:signal transduction histidine kinase